MILAGSGGLRLSFVGSGAGFSVSPRTDHLSREGRLGGRNSDVLLDERGFEASIPAIFPCGVEYLAN